MINVNLYTSKKESWRSRIFAMKSSKSQIKLQLVPSMVIINTMREKVREEWYRRISLNNRIYYDSDRLKKQYFKIVKDMLKYCPFKDEAKVYFTIIQYTLEERVLDEKMRRA